jgi:rRNA methylase
MDTNLNNLQIILCNTSHPGNIGSAARAMKTMGILNLVLVDPIHQPDDHTLALSCNAKDVVENAQIVHGLDAAIENSHLVIALTGRKREFSDNLLTPKEIMPEILSSIRNQTKYKLGIW